MTRPQLSPSSAALGSYLCVGLDTVAPSSLPIFRGGPDPFFNSTTASSMATKRMCVAYKINKAFYEVDGAKGWETMEKTVDYIPKPISTIADAKRGDIGNTSDAVSPRFLLTSHFDAITVASL